ncbi:MAG: peptidoglycan bridge formation glycyltransferase FemA/FemB family protein [Smithella sp.]|jgi:lipid II:glycine glycyltransferase (peptidoglycan interpeptide bridge formation enzyme)
MLIDKSQDSAYIKLDSIDTPKGVLTAWRCLQPDNPVWDAFLNSTPFGHFYQTSMWAQVRMLDGWDNLVILITINDRIVGGSQILTRSKSYLGKIGLVLKGPVVVSDDLATVNFVINTLKKIARVNKIQALIVQPPNRDKAISNMLSQNDFSANHVDHEIRDNTVVIDLRRDESTIFDAMKHNKRKNIKTALRMGVRVREGKADDINTFFRFMVDTCNRQQVKPSPSSEKFLVLMWNIFSRTDNIKLFISEYANEIISSLIVVPFGDTVYLWKFGWSGKFSNCRPNEILYWGIFKWAKANGFSFADLDAISPDLADKILKDVKATAEISQTYSYFKVGFGGEVAHLTKGFVYIYNPIVRWAYNIFMPYINSVPFLKRKILFGGE